MGVANYEKMIYYARLAVIREVALAAKIQQIMEGDDKGD